jgi:hypothetical protein
MKILITIITSLVCFCCYCQETNNQTYKILNQPNNIDSETYINAINKSDLQCFRYKSKNRVINFKSGFKIEIFSHDQLIENGIYQSKDCYLNNQDEAIDYQFEIINNTLVAAAPYDKSIKSKKNEKL